MSAKRIAFDGLLCAAYFALSFLIVPAGSLQIRLTSIALVVCAALFGPVDAILVGLIGEGLYQVLLFGVTVTTPLWLLPPVLHGLWLGLLLRPETKLPRFYVACFVGGLLNSAANTLALYVDSRVFGYYQFHAVFGVALLRFGLGLATAAVVATAAYPVVRALQKQVREVRA